jgi:hypothetical protein
MDAPALYMVEQYPFGWCTSDSEYRCDAVLSPWEAVIGQVIPEELCLRRVHMITGLWLRPLELGLLVSI